MYDFKNVCKAYVYSKIFSRVSDTHFVIVHICPLCGKGLALRPVAKGLMASEIHANVYRSYSLCGLT